MTLKLVLGHSVEEISGMVGVGVNTVKYRLKAGRARLREKLAGDPAVAGVMKEMLS